MEWSALAVADSRALRGRRAFSDPLSILDTVRTRDASRHPHHHRHQGIRLFTALSAHDGRTQRETCPRFERPYHGAF